MEIVLVRHGQSEANGAGVWQGRLDSRLTARGRREAAAVGERLARLDADLVLCSPLERARHTAAPLGRPPEIDEAWQEMDLGGWEGKSFAEVRRNHAEELLAIRAGDEVPFGGTGETLAGFQSRILDALDGLCQRLEGGSRAIVVTHGGVIDVVVAGIIGRRMDRRSFPIVSNSSMTVVARRHDRWVLDRFNDVAHLGVESPWIADQRRQGVPVVGFVRHGVTAANKSGTIQGQSCWGLDDEGRTQSIRFAEWYGPIDRVISSPLDRALQTAAALGDGGVEVDDSVIEIACGSWEGMTYPEVLAADPELARRIFHDGEDLPRGHVGETFADVGERMSEFVSRLRPDPESRTVVVTHGGAIRSLVGSMTGAGPEIRSSLGTPANTSVTHVALTEAGPMLADYALAPHLDADGPWMDDGGRRS